MSGTETGGAANDFFDSLGRPGEIRCLTVVFPGFLLRTCLQRDNAPTRYPAHDRERTYYSRRCVAERVSPNYSVKHFCASGGEPALTPGIWWPGAAGALSKVRPTPRR